MDILERLAQRKGNSQEATEHAARECVADPSLIDEVVRGLLADDARLAGDCAEVMTKLGQQRPEVLVPHVGALLAGLDHQNGRVRWESAHALALAAPHAPKAIEKVLPKLEAIVRDDGSVIVRDYCLDALAGYGATSGKAAARVFPALSAALDAFGGKHTARVLERLSAIALAAPKLSEDIQEHALRFSDSPKPGIRKAARALMKALG
ncbi:MAG: hypothetical protein QM765_33775 [Myxococcales bacterium]